MYIYKDGTSYGDMLPARPAAPAAQVLAEAIENLFEKRGELESEKKKAAAQNYWPTHDEDMSYAQEQDDYNRAAERLMVTIASIGQMGVGRLIFGDADKSSIEAVVDSGIIQLDPTVREKSRKKVKDLLGDE